MFMTYKIGFFFFVSSSNMAVYGPVLVRNGPKEAEKGRASSIQRKVYSIIGPYTVVSFYAAYSFLSSCSAKSIIKNLY